jgi:hypothetical protein
MPKEIFRELKKVKIRGAELRISRVDSKPPRPESDGRPHRPRFDRAARPDSPPGTDRPDQAPRAERPDRPKHRGSSRHTGGRRT